MSGDYSRWTINPRNNFATVLLQQGRILTDAEWNEEAVGTQRRIQAEALDVIGRAGVPSETPNGFRITMTGADLFIDPGRAYVDGILAENHGLPADAWAATLAELPGTSPVPYVDQPHLPHPPALPAAGKVLIYLKVWRRELTAVDEPSLIEPALGVDTTTRLRTIWQVKAIGVPASFVPGTPLATVASFVGTEAPATARLTVGTTAVEVDPSPCQIAPTGGYTGVENQLYRIEVHTPGPAGTATFKWSRDNATVAARVSSIPPTLDRLVVDRLGPDDVLSLHDGEWVELIDEARELGGSPGLMRRIKSGGGVDEATRTVLLTQPIGAGEFALDAQGRPAAGTNLRVRRWDQGTAVFDEAGDPVIDPTLDDGAITVPAGGVRLILEHGITVGFSTDPDNGVFRTGDYWVIPARTADPIGHETSAVPAGGIHAHYGPLALIDGGEVTDLRDVFPPLTGLDTLFYVAGDGQEVTPNTLAPAPIPLPVRPTVGVARGPIPVAGRTVRFALTGGGGGTINGGAAPVTVLTGADGTASVAWSVVPTADQQTLEARLLDSGGATRGLPVRFTARTRRAATVAYQPGVCADLAGVGTVQEALDRLCQRGGSGGRAGCCATVGADGDYATLEEALRDLAVRHDGDVCACLLPGEHEYGGPEIDFVRRLHLHGSGAVLHLPKPLFVVKAEVASLDGVEIVGAERLVVLLDCQDVRLASLGIRTESDEAETLVHMRRCGSVRIQDCSMVAAAQRVGAGPPRFTGTVRALLEAARAGDDAAIERVAIANRRAAVARRETAAAQLDAFATSGAGDPRLTQAARTLAELFRAGAGFDRFNAMRDDLAALAGHLDAPGRRRAALVIEEPSGPAWISGNDIVGGLSLYGIVGPQRIDELESRLDQILAQARDPFPVKVGGARLDVHHNHLTWTLLGSDPREVVAFESARIGQNVVNGGPAEIAAGRVSFSGNDIEHDGRLAGVVYADKAIATANIGTGPEPLLVLSARSRAAAANVGLAVVP